MTTTPEVKTGGVELEAEASTISPRLRSVAVQLDQPTPTTPRAKALAVETELEAAPVEARARSLAVQVGRNPARVFPLLHDFGAGAIVEAMEWSTDIHTAHDQTEQRMGNRSRGRRFLGYSAFATEDELPHAEALMYALQGQAMQVPVWTDAVKLSSSLPLGSTEVVLDTITRDYSAGGGILFMAPDRNAADYGESDTWYEVREVGGFLSDGLYLASGTTREWPRGTIIAPVRDCLGPTSHAWTRISAQRGSLAAEFELTDQGYPDLPEHSADLYQGRPVWPWRPNRAQPISESVGRVVTRIESVGGTVSTLPRRDRPSLFRSHRFLLDGRDEILEARALLHAIGGRRLQFWATSAMLDLELACPARAADSYITVKSVRGFDWYHHASGPIDPLLTSYTNPGRRDLEIRERPSATPIRRRVKSWARVGNGLEQVQLDDTLGVALSTGTTILSWLLPVRLEQDRVEFRWTTTERVELELAMRTL